VLLLLLLLLAIILLLLLLHLLVLLQLLMTLSVVMSLTCPVNGSGASVSPMGLSSVTMYCVRLNSYSSS
jgi:hypothetical protein